MHLTPTPTEYTNPIVELNITIQLAACTLTIGLIHISYQHSLHTHIVRYMDSTGIILCIVIRL